jgi:hypothetical protein
VLVESGERSLGSAGLVLERLLTGQEASVDDYLQLDDNDLLFFLKSWSRDSDPVLRDLSGRLLDRRLFKAVDLHLEPDQLEDLWPEAEELSRSLGFDPSYYLVKDRASDEPYYGYYSPSESAPDNLIYVEDEAEPAIREISEISRVVKSLRRYRIDRLCFPAEVSQPMLDLLANQLKVREA